MPKPPSGALLASIALAVKWMDIALAAQID